MSKAERIKAQRAEALRVLEGMNWTKLEAWIGLSHGRGFLPRRIKVVTRSKYWHVKIRIGVGSPRDLVFEASFATGVRVSYAAEHKPSGQDWFPILGMTPARCVSLANFCVEYLGAGYDWWSCLRFVPWIRTLIGEREGRRQVTRFNCSKYALKMIRAVGLEPIPRMLPFRCAPAHFYNSALLADPVTLDATGPVVL